MVHAESRKGSPGIAGRGTAGQSKSSGPGIGEKRIAGQSVRVKAQPLPRGKIHRGSVVNKVIAVRAPVEVVVRRRDGAACAETHFLDGVAREDVVIHFGNGDCL